MKRHAIVTGGSRGIGWEISKALAGQGYDLYVTGLNPITDALRTSIVQWEREDISVRYEMLDNARDDLIAPFVDRVAKTFGRIDLLVNNAGMAPPIRCDILDVATEDYQRVMDVNLRGMFCYSQRVAHHMLEQEASPSRGMIINISSMSAYTISTDRAAYCISKAGVSMTTQLFAKRLAPDNIFVYEIRPGIIATDMTRAAQAKYDRLFASNFLPVNRWGKPEDVANAVLHLATAPFPYAAGQVIDIDGGFHIRSI